MPRPLLALLLLLILAVGCRGSDGGPADSGLLADHLSAAPDANIVVISFDALRPEYLGVYGQEKPVTPRLDEFAKEALVFENAYSAAQSTPTSFAAAFTGRYPFRIFLKWRLADVPTLAGTLTEAGYRTGGFFNNRQLDPERNFGQGFENFVVDYNPDETEFLGEAMTWLDEVAGDRFFMWIHFISPHAPYRNRAMSQQFYTPGYTGRFAGGSGPIDDLDSIDDPEELARFKELYIGEVHYADHLFGVVWDALAERDLVDNSVVMVTADHGEGLMDHDVLFHQKVYDEVVRIPLLIRHPRAQRGGRTDIRVSNVDFFPTLAGVAGLETPPDIDGTNLQNGDPGPRPLLMTSMTNMKHRSMGMLWGDHKLIANCDRPSRPTWELYDLRTDPAETNNVYNTTAVVGDSLRAIMDALTEVGPCGAIRAASRGRSATEGLTPEKIEQLKSLGYVR